MSTGAARPGSMKKPRRKSVTGPLGPVSPFGQELSVKPVSPAGSGLPAGQLKPSTKRCARSCGRRTGRRRGCRGRATWPRTTVASVAGYDHRRRDSDHRYGSCSDQPAAGWQPEIVLRAEVDLVHSPHPACRQSTKARLFGRLDYGSADQSHSSLRVIRPRPHIQPDRWFATPRPPASSSSRPARIRRF